MNRTDKVMVVCPESREGVPGKQTLCSVCGRKVFLSDTTLASAFKSGFRKDNILIHCLKCSIPKFCEITEYVPLTEEQKQEMDRIKQWAKSKH